MDPSRPPFQQMQFQNVHPPSILEFNNALYEKHCLIKPPEEKEAVNRVTEKILVIDSRSRDRFEYPEPNAYTIELPDEYKDVISIQLISYLLSTSQPTIRITNNCFYFNEEDPEIIVLGGGRYEIAYSKTNTLKTCIPVGYYSDEIDLSLQQDRLAMNLQDALTNRTSSNPTDFATSNVKITISPYNFRYELTTDFFNTNSSSPLDDPSATCFFHLFPFGPNFDYNQLNDPENYKVLNTEPNNSIGQIMGFYLPTTDNLLTGICSCMSGTTMVGIGTLFKTQLAIGDWLFIQPTTMSATPLRYQVTDITDNTHCILQTPSSSAFIPFTTSFVWVGRILSPGIRNLYADSYIIMKMAGGSVIDSPTDIVNGSFTIIPTRTTNYEVLDNVPTIKKYNPILGRLQRLSFSFFNPDNTPYDFMGIDHTLTFRVTRYIQNINFANF